MTIQVQTRGNRFDAAWEIYGEWRGKTVTALPKYAKKMVAELRHDEHYREVRVVTSDHPDFLREAGP